MVLLHNSVTEVSVMRKHRHSFHCEISPAKRIALDGAALAQPDDEPSVTVVDFALSSLVVFM